MCGSEKSFVGWLGSNIVKSSVGHKDKKKFSADSFSILEH